LETSGNNRENREEGQGTGTREIKFDATFLIMTHLALKDRIENEWFRYVLDNPAKPWDWTNVSGNKNISSLTVETHLDLPWDFNELSLWIDLDVILRHPDRGWNWHRVSSRPDIDLKIITDNRLPWNWSALSDIVPWHFVQSRPQIRWNWHKLSRSPKISNVVRCIYRDYPWDWRYLTRCISFNFIMNNPEKEWDWRYLSIHPDIKIEHILAHPTKPWDWEALSHRVPPYQKAENPQLPWRRNSYSSEICEPPDRYETYEVIRSTPDKVWYWDEFIYMNPNCTKDIVDKYCVEIAKWIEDGPDSSSDEDLYVEHEDTGEMLPRLLYKLGECSCVTWNLIACSKYLQESIDWYELSKNPNITWDIVEQNMGMPWSWDGLSQNPNITWRIIDMESDHPWDWSYFTHNVDWSVVSKYPDKPWNWSEFSYDPDLDIVSKFPDKPWSWGVLSKGDVPLHIIEKNIDRPWDWGERGISKNKYLNWDFVERHREKGWSWVALSKNTMKYYFDSLQFLLDKYTEMRRERDGISMYQEIVAAAWRRPLWMMYHVVATGDPDTERDEAYGQFDIELSSSLCRGGELSITRSGTAGAPQGGTSETMKILEEIAHYGMPNRYIVFK
jgi:hypothetical protein